MLQDQHRKVQDIQKHSSGTHNKVEEMKFKKKLIIILSVRLQKLKHYTLKCVLPYTKSFNSQLNNQETEMYLIKDNLTFLKCLKL